MRLSPDILVNIAYVIYAFALASKHAIWLRTFLFLTSLTFLTLAIQIDDKVLQAWNVLFCLISGFRLLELILENRFLHLEPELVTMWRRAFPKLSKREFLTFWDMGADVIYSKGLMIEQGKAINHLMLLRKGATQIVQNEIPVAKRGVGEFLGEMSLFTADMASATVLAEEATTVRLWPHEKLRALEVIEPSLFEKVQETLTLVLVSKANEQGEQSGAH